MTPDCRTTVTLSGRRRRTKRIASLAFQLGALAARCNVEGTITIKLGKDANA